MTSNRRFLNRHKLEAFLTACVFIAAALPGLTEFGVSWSQLGRYNANLAVLAITAVAVIWYTSFTHQTLLEMRAAQRATRIRDLKQIAALADLLLIQVSSLPRERDLTTFRNADVWDEFAEQSLLGLRSSEDGVWASKIGKAIDALGWLRKKLELCQQSDGSRAATSLREIQSVEWVDRLDQAIEALSELCSETRRLEADLNPASV